MLTLSSLGKIFSWRQIEIFFLIRKQDGFNISCKLSPMKCQILFTGKNKKKNITNLSPAELAQKVVKVKMLFSRLHEWVHYINLYHSLSKFSRRQIDYIFLIYFFQKIGFNIPCKLSPKETICMKCQSLFSGENKKNISNCRLLIFFPTRRALRQQHKVQFPIQLTIFCLFMCIEAFFGKVIVLYRVTYFVGLHVQCSAS